MAHIHTHYVAVPSQGCRFENAVEGWAVRRGGDDPSYAAGQRAQVNENPLCRDS